MRSNRCQFPGRMPFLSWIAGLDVAIANEFGIDAEYCVERVADASRHLPSAYDLSEHMLPLHLTHLMP
ncbi:MAG: hypothetical protein WCF60_13085 [Anaerobacillus sp.]